MREDKENLNIKRLIEIRDRLNYPMSKVVMAAAKVGLNENSIRVYLNTIGQAVIRRHQDGRSFTPEECDEYAIRVAKSNA